MANIAKRVDDFLVRWLWGGEAEGGKMPHPPKLKLLRIFYIIVRSLGEEQIILRAMSLVYTSLLSLVPLLAVSFSVLKAFGVHARFLIFLYYFLEPLGESGVDLSMKIIGFVESVKVGVLGSIGLSALIYTVISTIQKVESSLNYIWNIKGTRGFSQRFSNYMSVLLVGPVLLFSAFGITATIMGSTIMKKAMAVQALGMVVYIISGIAPYFLVAAAFTFVYIFLPNTRVRFRAALTGGIAAAVLWQTIGWVFTSFIASSAQYSAIYSGFATLVLLLIWLYWNFLTLLIGARISYYIQHPRLLDTGGKAIVLSDRLKERLALGIMLLVGRDFHSGRQRGDLTGVASRLGMPASFVQEVLTLLEEKALLVRTQNEPLAFVPARDPEVITLNDIIAAVRTSGEDAVSRERPAVFMPEVEEIMKHVDDAISSSLQHRTLKELIMSAEKSGA